MGDRDWIGWVRREIRKTAELAAVAEAAVRSMQDTGGTPHERAGLLCIVGLVRCGAANAMEELGVADRCGWVDGIEGPR